MSPDGGAKQEKDDRGRESRRPPEEDHRRRPPEGEAAGLPGQPGDDVHGDP
jgi:hypothetical protein